MACTIRSEPYVAAITVQRRLLTLTQTGDNDADMVARAALAWIELEQFKRQTPGIPALKPVSAGELLALKREKWQRRPRAIAESIEVQRAPASPAATTVPTAHAQVEGPPPE
jgi:hypothetical protein